MRKRAVFFYVIALFGFAFAQPAHAITLPIEETPTASPIAMLQSAVAGIVSGAEAIFASIESTVGDLADSVSKPTPHSPSSHPANSYAAAAASIAAPRCDHSPDEPRSRR